MKAVRVHDFGGLEAIVYEDAPRPDPGEGQVLVRVKAAGVGPWDAWVRAGKSALSQSLPLTRGSDLSGVVEGTIAAMMIFCIFLRIECNAKSRNAYMISSDCNSVLRVMMKSFASCLLMSN